MRSNIDNFLSLKILKIDSNMKTTKENEKSKSMFEEALKIDPSYKPALDNLSNLEKID